MRVVKGETSSHQSYSRSAKGNVSVQEVSPEGKFVVLENTHRAKEENIGEWKLKRRIDGKREIVYTFPKDFVLRPGKTVRIWARGQGGVHVSFGGVCSDKFQLILEPARPTCLRRRGDLWSWR